MSTSKLELAKALLDGMIVDRPNDRIGIEYLKARTPEEQQARQALANLLRSPGELDPQLRESLASLFDPAPPPRQQRKLAFKFRRRGSYTDHFANAQIFIEVNDAIRKGAKTAHAIISVAGQHSLSEELVKRIWSQHRREYLAQHPQAED
jgi:hypothetical protein